MHMTKALSYLKYDTKNKFGYLKICISSDQCVESADEGTSYAT